MSVHVRIDCPSTSAARAVFGALPSLGCGGSWYGAKALEAWYPGPSIPQDVLDSLVAVGGDGTKLDVPR